jgi:hypothetical protein
MRFVYLVLRGVTALPPEADLSISVAVIGREMIACEVQSLARETQASPLYWLARLLTPERVDRIHVCRAY